MARFHSPLGGDALVLTGFAGDEGINHLGEFRVEALSAGEGVDLDACLGRNACVGIGTIAHGPRFFDGVVAEAEFLGVADMADGTRSWHYRFILRPWFWLASLRRNQRIFHDKTVPEIIAEVLADYAGFPVESRLTGAYDALEYTVQYRETDLAFVCRMAERFGISWHFEHEEGRHTMVLSDNAEAFRAAPGGSRPFRALGGSHQRPEERFTRWQAGRRVTTGRVTLTDYNFRTPDAAMLAEQSAGHGYAQGRIESFDYPGGYPAQGPGGGVARLRGTQESGSDGVQSADGDCLSLAPGTVFTLDEHPDAGVNGRSWLVTRADHHYDGEYYRSGGGRRSDGGYRGHFRLFPAERPFTPARVTPLSVMPGPQTATVVGEGEIDCDEYGRILVRFPWDRHSAHSMRCRVSQSWAGNGWGGMVVPRIGMEVVVEFLEGDPDQPLVTGCVYNGRQKVPYDLPGHKTKSVFRSDTHQGEGFNEVSFEDQAGQEKIYVHAQKDQDIHVGNNRAKRVDVSEVESIGNSKFSEIGKDMNVQIGGNAVTAIGMAEVQLNAPRPMAAFDEGPLQLAYKVTLPEAPDATRGHYRLIVAQSMSEQIGTQSSRRIGDSASVSVGTSYTLNVGAKSGVSVGADSYETVGGGRYMHVAKEIDLRCGASRLLMKSNGDILIQGLNIRLRGSQIDMN